jgi:hypothetical protein
MTSPIAISQPGHKLGDSKMKATMLALALLASSGAPVLADGFPNPFQTNFDR